MWEKLRMAARHVFNVWELFKAINLSPSEGELMIWMRDKINLFQYRGRLIGSATATVLYFNFQFKVIFANLPNLNFFYWIRFLYSPTTANQLLLLCTLRYTFFETKEHTSALTQWSVKIFILNFFPPRPPSPHNTIKLKKKIKTYIKKNYNKMLSILIRKLISWKIVTVI